VPTGRLPIAVVLTGLTWPRYVEMLESQQAQLVAGLQELYKRTQNGQGWMGSPLKETSQGVPLTHDILERLGVLKQDGHTVNERFEEDLNVLQQKLIADGAGFMQRQPSYDTNSESEHSPMYEPAAQKPAFSNPFSLNKFPPTPPNQSPYPQSARAVPSMKSQIYPRPSAGSGSSSNHHTNLQWTTAASEFEDSMDFINQFESPVVDPGVDLSSFPPTMFQEPQAVPTAINPCLTMKDWAGQEDLQRYFNPAMI